MSNRSRPLRKFRALCQELLVQGVKPTPTEFFKRGLGYTNNVKGSGCTWASGYYTQARAEELAIAGYVPVQHGKVTIWEKMEA